MVGKGKRAEALRYAKEIRDINCPSSAIPSACESILLESGMALMAYHRYAIKANKHNTRLATFRPIVKKCPHKDQPDILNDLVASTPGEEGKWFAAAKSAGYDYIFFALSSCTFNRYASTISAGYFLV